MAPKFFAPLLNPQALYANGVTAIGARPALGCLATALALAAKDALINSTFAEPAARNPLIASVLQNRME